MYNFMKSLVAMLAAMYIIRYYDPSPKPVVFCIAVAFLCSAVTYTEREN